jgi:hypothetical protein
VGFRGTVGTVEDWLLDFEFFYKNLSYPGCVDCELHEGFYGAFLALWPGIEAALHELGALTAPYIHVSGHSLGAAMSEIATFELVASGYPVKRAYSFGTPRVGNPAWASAYSDTVVAAANVSSFRVVHSEDPVPHLPPQWLPASASGRRGAAGPGVGGLGVQVTSASTTTLQTTDFFRHPPQEVWYNNASSAFRVCSATNGEDPTCSDSVTLPDKFHEHDMYLNISMGCPG